MYRTGGAYRIEYAGEHEVEIASWLPKRTAFWRLSRIIFVGHCLRHGQRATTRSHTGSWDGCRRPRGCPGRKAAAEPRCFPNPFNASVTVGPDMPDAGWLQVDVYDVLGRPVRQLLAEQRSAGPWHAVWDGRDEQGRAAASGSYFIAIRAAEQRYSARVTLLR